MARHDNAYVMTAGEGAGGDSAERVAVAGYMYDSAPPVVAFTGHEARKGEDGPIVSRTPERSMMNAHPRHTEERVHGARVAGEDMDRPAK